MKKSVIILIGIIYAASITLVTFFGLQYNNYVAEEIPVSTVTITNENLRFTDSGKKYVALFANEAGERKFQVEYKVAPDDAYNKDVIFHMEENDYATVDENGLVTFSVPNRSVELYVISSSDTGKYDVIDIIFLN